MHIGFCADPGGLPEEGGRGKGHGGLWGSSEHGAPLLSRDSPSYYYIRSGLHEPSGQFWIHVEPFRRVVSWRVVYIRGLDPEGLQPPPLLLALLLLALLVAPWSARKWVHKLCSYCPPLTRSSVSFLKTWFRVLTPSNLLITTLQGLVVIWAHLVIPWGGASGCWTGLGLDSCKGRKYLCRRVLGIMGTKSNNYKQNSCLPSTQEDHAGPSSSCRPPHWFFQWENSYNGWWQCVLPSVDPWSPCMTESKRGAHLTKDNKLYS